MINTQALTITRRLNEEKGWNLDEETMEKIADWAFMGTQYASRSSADREAILSYLTDEMFNGMDDEELIEYTQRNEILSFDDEFYPMGSLDELLEGRSPTDIVMLASFGDHFNTNDDYFYFNGYGNLESLDEWQLAERLRDLFDEDIKNCCRDDIEGAEDDDELDYAGQVCDALVKAGY